MIARAHHDRHYRCGDIPSSHLEQYLTPLLPLAHRPSQSSGVAVSQECLEAFQSLKLGKKLKFIIYTLSSDNREIVVAKTSSSSNYDDFLAELPAAECRYAIYDFEYEKGDEGKRSKICFFTW